MQSIRGILYHFKVLRVRIAFLIKLIGKFATFTTAFAISDVCCPNCIIRIQRWIHP